MPDQLSPLTIGLFGTCGKSTWRKPFMDRYTAEGIPFFNPQVDDWKPELAEEEAWHLANDLIILFPVTAETYAVGSLSEVGFSILNAIKLDDRREIVILLEQSLESQLMVDVDRATESLRARALIKQHLLKMNLPNVYIVDTMQEMLDISLTLFAAAKLRHDHAARFSVKARQK